MASITELRARGLTFFLSKRGIEEPLTAPESLAKKLTRFPEEIYNTNPDSHLYRFLLTLCGAAGAGSIKQNLLYSKLQTQLATTHFGDLDRFYGGPLFLSRLDAELYSFDPTQIILTRDEWMEVWAKDASYRNRCLTWMQAIMHGSSPEGMRLAAEAATGIECDIHERYTYLENTFGTDDPIEIDNIGKTQSAHEFVIVPRAPAVTEAQKRRIIRLVDLLRGIDTIPTIYASGVDPRLAQPVRSLDASSSYSQVLRLVTGRPDVVWHEVDTEQGFWIETNVEKEAPTYAWIDRQEAVTFLTIENVEASSEHYGQFNSEQRHLLHIGSDEVDDFYKYEAKNSFAKAFVQLGIETQWFQQKGKSKSNQQGKGSETGGGRLNNLIVNNYYPLDYLANVDLSEFAATPADKFWASYEREHGAEYLILDLGRDRPMSYISAEITRKPISVTVEVSSDRLTWTEVVPKEGFEPTLDIDYSPNTQPWLSFEHHFELVQARYLRLTFTRRDVPFPFPDTRPFPWSIEVRNIRIIHIMSNPVETFVTDSGVDILRNFYRTTLHQSIPEYVVSDDPTHYWQSQPNPVRNAVEALYFDLTTDAGDAVVVEEIYLDPITLGCDFHVYYSNDVDESDWDSKLWIPVNQHYKLTKGFHALPTPVTAKFFKLEFSNLVAMPYNTIDHPLPLTHEYRHFPTWVQNYFSDVHPKKGSPIQEESVDRVTIDPYDLYRVTKGVYEKGRGELLLSPETTKDSSADSEIQAIIKETNTPAGSLTQNREEGKIRFFPPTIWRGDLREVLDLDRAASRYVYQQRDGEVFMVEQAPLSFPLPSVQSAPDLSDSLAEKEAPLMWFPRKARHAYQIVEAPFQQKLAYSVAIRVVSFWRRDYTVAFDEPLYSETLDDDVNVEINEFILDGDVYRVP